MEHDEILKQKVCLPDQYATIDSLIKILKENYTYYKKISPDKIKELEILKRNQDNINKEMKKQLKEVSVQTMDMGLTILRNKLRDIDQKIKNCTNNSKLIKLQGEKTTVMSSIRRQEDRRKNLAMIKDVNIVKTESVNKLIESLEKVSGKKVTLKEGTWAIPDDEKKALLLQKIVNKLKSGDYHSDITKKITSDLYNVLGEDYLFDQIGDLGNYFQKDLAEKIVKRAKEYVSAYEKNPKGFKDGFGPKAIEIIKKL